MITSGRSGHRRAVLERRSRLLAYATVGYNLVEGVVAVTAGVKVASTALLGFGVDSFIEVSSALVVIWQFRSRSPATRERVALRGIAVSFFALAAWITFDAATALRGGRAAETSGLGIGIALASLVVMPILVRAKRRAGRELGSATVVADATQTLLCTWMSISLLAGLAVNAAFGWWWADPIAALVIAVFALKEGAGAWRGETCTNCALPTGPVGNGGCEGTGGCCDSDATAGPT